MLVVSLFPPDQWIVGWQFVFLFIWWGAASSKLNRHFPFVISVMVSNTPWNRSKKVKRRSTRTTRRTCGRRARGAGRAPRHRGRVRSAAAADPVDNDVVGTLAIVGMILFHVHITSTFALGVPLEWNLFMIFGLAFLFGHYGDVPLERSTTRC